MHVGRVNWLHMSRRTALLLACLALALGLFIAADGADAVASLVEAALVGDTAPAVPTVAQAPPQDLPEPWPPALGQPYPDLQLLDRDGQPVRLSQWRGQAILLEPVGMTCPACQGFSGANEIGAFPGAQVQRSAWAIERLLENWGDGVEIGTPGLVYVQVLLYDMKMGPPGPDDAAAWDEHFDISGRGGHVLVPSRDLRHRDTYRLIPGFQLIGRDFVLRRDASGHHPVHSYSELLGAIRPLL